MSKYKDKNGTTKVGDFLRSLGDVGKPILQAAGGLTGQAWLTNIAGQITTSKELNEQQKSIALEYHKSDLLDVQNARDNETLRDNNINSTWLSKNIHELIALVVIGAWISTWFMNLPDVVMIAKDAVMLILGYLYGRTKPQS